MENFIEKANRIHNNKYDYSKTEYVNTTTKVCIICPEHGEFWQTPKQHLKGQGCPKCGRNKANKKLSFDKETWMKKAAEIHGDKYDYSKVEYINANTKVCIICPEHGEFWQIPNNHLRGQGCPKCGGHLLDIELFSEKAGNKHKNKYDYSKVCFRTNKDKITIICPDHGEFIQSVNDHLNGCGCPACGKIEQANKRRKSYDEVINSFREVHGNKYDYSKVEYVNNHIPVTIICPEHGEFKQTPNNHLSGAGCPRCNQSYGEKCIKLYLEKHNIKFTYQKSFEWLKYKRRQKLDFYLDDFNIAIEFQGIQHYQPVFWCQYGQEEANKQFEKVINYDNNKKKLCEEHGIKIFYIKYNDNIKHSLDKIIKNNPI